MIVDQFVLKHARRAYRAGQYKQVIADCKRILQQDPRHAGAWYGLGLAYQGLRQYRNGLKAFHRVIKLKWHQAEAWVEVGHLHWWLREHVLARRAYRQALRVDSQQIQAHYGLGISAFHAEKFTEAKRHLRQAVRSQPHNVWALGYLGYMALLDKRWPQAVVSKIWVDIACSVPAIGSSRRRSYQCQAEVIILTMRCFSFPAPSLHPKDT